MIQVWLRYHGHHGARTNFLFESLMIQPWLVILVNPSGTLVLPLDFGNKWNIKIFFFFLYGSLRLLWYIPAVFNFPPPYRALTVSSRVTPSEEAKSTHRCSLSRFVWFACTMSIIRSHSVSYQRLWNVYRINDFTISRRRTLQLPTVSADCEHDGKSYSMSEIVERRLVFMITIRS